MRFTVEVSPEGSPNTVGEFLRSQFFSDEIGCYSCFDWAEGVTPLSNLPLEGEHNHEKGVEAEDFCWACYCKGEVWTRAERVFGESKVECRYHWDGDGVLAFGFPDGSWLVNTDCKCDYDWEYHEKYSFND